MVVVVVVVNSAERFGFIIRTRPATDHSDLGQPTIQRS
ncbi:Uncharacterized protein dnm_037340 [Desulfonema magnum]|uniref:Uncharacterized protein n=1 Tax=Desulfonema magnum TaxID=45655 RepID=A0A975BMF7_9BACT|nr:Uncharacterized protein dnm_037340 [Desulfonema magnum]